MSLLRYGRYKESGVAWLGEMPEHWALNLGRHHFAEKREPSAEPDEQLSATQKYGVIPQTLFMQREDQKVVLALKGLDSFKHVEVDDFIISLRSFQGGIEKSHYQGCVSTAYTVLRARGPIAPDYWKYLFKSDSYISVLRSVTDGIREGKSISYDQFGSVSLPIPPLKEQEQIAKFLDRETAKIDALIEEQRRLIALLKEKRQAVISHAVTKGLNPSAPMNDYKNRLFGSTPIHWQAVQVRRVLEKLEQGWSPQCDAQPAAPGEWGVLKSGCVNRGVFSEAENKALPLSIEPIPAYEIHAGDVLMSRASGSPELVGSTALVKQTREKLMLSDKIFRLHLASEMLPEYFVALFNSDLLRRQIESAISGADGLANNLPQASLKEFVLTLPPRSDQRDIVAYLQRIEVQYQFAGINCNHMIELLLERRSALISATVTGKINVIAQVAKPVRSTWSADFARHVLAAETLSRCNGSRMGRIKLQKLIHLCEYHAQLDEVRGTYSRQAAGPFAPQVMEDVREGLLQQRWFEEYKDESRYAYRALEKAGEHKQYLPHWKDQQAKIDLVLNLLGGELTRKCEIASTLYAAWNDLLIEGKKPTDAEIIHEASSAERWHESKEKIAAEKWPEALKWMRANGLVPVGYGTHTMHQPDLFKRERHEPA